MNNQGKKPDKALRLATGVIILIISLVGGILLALAVAIPEEHRVTKDFARELGIVLLSVCGVSMIYEVFVAEQHFLKFFGVLREQLARGESNAAVCERLGIRAIFASREVFENKYPLPVLIAGAASGVTLQIVARTLYLLMNRPGAIRDAIAQGGRVELCCFDPAVVSEELRELSGLENFDTSAALATFRKNVAGWLLTEAPPGEIEIRYHRVHLFDSFFSFVLDGERLAVWDMSFGRHVSDKRIFFLDIGKGLGADLGKRYATIWKRARTVFEYKGGQVRLDQLPP